MMILLGRRMMRKDPFTSNMLPCIMLPYIMLHRTIHRLLLHRHRTCSHPRCHPTIHPTTTIHMILQVDRLSLEVCHVSIPRRSLADTCSVEHRPHQSKQACSAAKGTRTRGQEEKEQGKEEG